MTAKLTEMTDKDTTVETFQKIFKDRWTQKLVATMTATISAYTNVLFKDPKDEMKDAQEKNCKESIGQQNEEIK